MHASTSYPGCIPNWDWVRSMAWFLFFLVVSGKPCVSFALFQLAVPDRAGRTSILFLPTSKLILFVFSKRSTFFSLVASSFCNARFKMSAGSKSRALTNRQVVMQRKSEMTHHQRQERYQMLKNERLRREREEYESLTPEQRRRRDLKDEKKARKGKGKHKVGMFDGAAGGQSVGPLSSSFFLFGPPF